MTLEKSCPVCEEQFETYPSIDKTYCSRDCANEAKRGSGSGPTLETVKCETCGGEFEAQPAFDRSYCSVECQHESLKGDFTGKQLQELTDTEGQEHPRWVDREVRTCPVCESEFEVRETSLQKTCSVECGHNGLRTYDEELEHMVRSSWERTVAQLLVEADIKYQYEGVEVEYEGGSYYPDFVTDEAVIEVKGRVRDSCIKKAETAVEQLEKRYVVVGSEMKSDIHISWEMRDEVINYV